MRINRHGLSRHIPAAVKAEVRKRCSFGCVVCGAIPYDYDHFIVPWVEARFHDPEDIVLLCDKHHRHKNSGLLDLGSIKTALALRSNQQTDARFKLDSTAQEFAIHWPHNHIEASMQGILVDGNPILRLEMQEDELEPIVLSGAFTDLTGQEICVINRNEFVSRTSAVGDVTIIGNRFSYFASSGQKTLQFVLQPSGIEIEHLFHVRGDAFVRSMPDHLLLGNLTSSLRASGNHFADCGAAIALESFADDWDFISYDITQRQSSMTLTDCSMISCGVGLAVSAPPKYRPTFKFGW